MCRHNIKGTYHDHKYVCVCVCSGLFLMTTCMTLILPVACVDEALISFRGLTDVQPKMKGEKVVGFISMFYLACTINNVNFSSTIYHQYDYSLLQHMTNCSVHAFEVGLPGSRFMLHTHAKSASNCLDFIPLVKYIE